MAKKTDEETNSKKSVKKATVKKTAVKKVTTKKTAKVAKVKETSKVEHVLIPVHEKISEKEIQELFDYHNITIKELPKILKTDPAIRHLDVSENDVIKITRNSPTAGKTVFYRGVINE